MALLPRDRNHNGSHTYADDIPDEYVGCAHRIFIRARMLAPDDSGKRSFRNARGRPAVAPLGKRAQKHAAQSEKYLAVLSAMASHMRDRRLPHDDGIHMGASDGACEKRRKRAYQAQYRRCPRGYPRGFKQESP